MKTTFNYLSLVASLFLIIFLVKDLYYIIIDFNKFIIEAKTNTIIYAYGLSVSLLLTKLVDTSSEIFNQKTNKKICK